VPTTRAPRQPRRAARQSPSVADSATKSGSPSDHFRYALTPPIQARKDTVTLTESSIAQLFDLDHHTPARILLPTVARHLDDISTLLRGTFNKTLRRRLIASGGQAAALAGRLALDRGDTAEAHKYWDSAIAAARDAADGPLLACVQMYLSHAAMQQGDHNTAWQFAHSASGQATEEPRVQAWIAVQTAQAAARRGDSAAALAELKLAQDWDLEIGPPPAPSDTAPPWARFIDHAYLWAMAAHVHTRIGDRDNAHHAAVRAIDTLSGNRVKTRAIILAEAAYAFAYLGGTERARQHATEALNLAETLEVPSATQRLQELAVLLPEPLGKTGQDVRQQSQRARASRTRKARHRSRPAKADQASNQAAAASEMQRGSHSRCPSPESWVVV
jgi:ATP/maltotriose-dependent transcriptional regulator MalT